jgi:ubiquitin carboxyl-terminal hydrolase 7
MPSRRPIASGTDFVAEYCAAFSKVHDIFYEVLDMPLKELEQLQTMRVLLVKANLEVVRSLSVRLPKESSVRELLAKVGRSLEVFWLVYWQHVLQGTRVKLHSDIPSP